jgi:hypothetical protein
MGFKMKFDLMGFNKIGDANWTVWTDSTGHFTRHDDCDTVLNIPLWSNRDEIVNLMENHLKECSNEERV